MEFQKRLKTKVKSVESGLTPRFKKILQDDIDAQQSRGQEAHILQIGQPMPNIELTDQNGKKVSAHELLKKGPLVLAFYRGFWCSFCNVDLANLNHYVKDIEALGANLFAISPERAPYSKKIVAVQKLKFAILEDSNNSIAQQFGLKYQVTDELKDLYRSGFNVNLKQYHGNDEWSLPMPARYLIDQDGIVQYAEAKADYRERPDPDDLITALKSILN
ncbi:MAG: peroxiredoxin [Saprospiraceae bacterium]|jgi:peroxiredoxin